MFPLLVASALVCLLSFSSAAPTTTDDCDELTRRLPKTELPQVLGRWIMIEVFFNDSMFNLPLERLESNWIDLSPTADSDTLRLISATPMPDGPHQVTRSDQAQQHQSQQPPPDQNRQPQPSSQARPFKRGRCMTFSHNVSITDDEDLEISLEVARSNYRVLQTCSGCMLWEMYTPDNDIRLLYFLARNTTVADTDLDTLKKQAACLQFPLPAKFHYDPSKELCPEQSEEETTAEEPGP